WTFSDLGLEYEEENITEDGWPESFIVGVFDIPYQNFNLMAVSIGTQMFGSKILISLDSNEDIIDAVDVGAYIGAALPNANYYYPMQWSINSNMELTTYQLKPTSTTPYLFETDIPFPLNAQRIDRSYKIDSLGYFTLISEIKYQPENYPIGIFIDKSHKIRTGGENLIQNRVNVDSTPSIKKRLIK
ncbi:MAG: hypothetical protein RR212_13825, partial [Bacteroidales bacterium]